MITDGFVCRQDWTKKNFLVTIDPSLRGRSGPVSHQIVAKPDVFVRDLVKIDLPVKEEWKAWTARMRAEQSRSPALPPATPGDGPARMDTLMANLVPPLPAGRHGHVRAPASTPTGRTATSPPSATPR